MSFISEYFDFQYIFEMFTRKVLQIKNLDKFSCSENGCSLSEYSNGLKMQKIQIISVVTVLL